MHRLEHLINGDWIAHSHEPVFETGKRLVAGASGDKPSMFTRMVECMAPPYYLLYVLHTPRGEGAPGRYQSPAMPLSSLQDFVSRFSPFLAADGRFDLWAHSPGGNATVVWDRHDLLFGYGPLEAFETSLRSLGYTPGQPVVPTPHQHHYRAEFDGLARELLSALDWERSPLKPSDEQA